MIKYNIAQPYFPEGDIHEILARFEAVLRGDGMLTMGEWVAEFERRFAEYVGTRHAVATNSCTSALEIVLKALGVGAGDEVIVPTQTFIATGSCIAINGARPVFCNIGRDHLMDIEDLKARITPRTRAVIMVHFAGMMRHDLAEIRQYLSGRGIALVEDAAHAHGASAGGVKAGSIGAAGCFSFFSTKIMTTGEGGMITTNSDGIYDLCRSMRNRGIDISSPAELFSNLGSNRRMSEIQGLMGCSQLGRVEEFVSHRNMVASIYNEVLDGPRRGNLIRFQPPAPGVRHAYWRFMVMIEDSIVPRQSIKEGMERAGVKVDWPYDPPLHLQPVFRRMFGPDDGSLARSEQTMKRHFCLPMHMGIGREDAVFIAEALKGILK